MIGITFCKGVSRRETYRLGELRNFRILFVQQRRKPRRTSLETKFEILRCRDAAHVVCTKIDDELMNVSSNVSPNYTLIHDHPGRNCISREAIYYGHYCPSCGIFMERCSFVMLVGKV